MATLTKKQSTDFKKQIDEAQRQITALSQQQMLKQAPAGQLNSAQQIGASGRGADNYPTAVSKQIKEATETGVPMSALGDTNESGQTNLEKPKQYSAPRLSADQADGFVKSFGLEGMVDGKKFTGMTANEANTALLAEKKTRQDQVSANTSAVFNPEVTSKTKRAIDNLGFALNDITNSPFEGKTTKLNKTASLIESTSKQLSQLFSTPEEFNQAYNTNQTFKDALDRFQKFGGKPDAITSGITTPVTTPVVGDQTTSQYLADIKNPLANQVAEKQALAELIPERDVDQAEIARIGKIPKELVKFYMGDEATVGLVAQRKAEGEEEMKIAEREEKNEKASLKARAQFAIDRNTAEVKIQSAQNEENRLAAKNYMTGYLAKLGALNTTGAAGLAIQTLDTKYDIARTELETNLKYANQKLALNLTSDINDVEIATDKEVLKIQQDLSKTTEDVFKEISKAQQASDKEIYNITSGYSKTLRERTAKYTQDIKDAAEAYAKKFAKMANTGVDLGFTNFGKPTKNNRMVQKITAKLRAARGGDGHYNPSIYFEAYEEWIAAGGTPKTFTAEFPSSTYTQPHDNYLADKGFSLPQELRYAKKSQTIPKDDDDEDDEDEDEENFDTKPK